MDVYSTASVPRGVRASYWNQVYSQRFAQVTFSPVDRDGFEAELRVGVAGPLGIARIHSKPTHIERNQTHINRNGERLFSFLLQARGSGVFSHYGHETRMEEGDFTLCDNSTPHRFNCSGNTELIVLRTSPEVLRAYLPDPERFCGQRLPAARGMTGAAANLAQTLWTLVEGGLADKFGGMVARNVLDMLATSYAIAFDGTVSESSAINARKLQARRYIEAHLRESELSACSVAEALGISARYLRMLFGRGEESVSRYILRRRLEECARQLSSPMWQGHTLTEIAFGCGFNSSAHFARAFRDEYGVTPTQYRRGSRRSCADSGCPSDPSPA